MTTPILKVPIYYKPNEVDQYKDSGGDSTSLIELPTSYAIGLYRYSKSDLSPIKNGSIGLLTEGGVENNCQVYNSEGVNHRAVLPVLGYYSGGQFRFSTANNQAIGTLGRKVNPLPYIRDTRDNNIVYLILSPSNEESGKFNTIARFNQAEQTTEWRSFLDAPIMNETEYLYQDTNNLYFLTSNVLINKTNYDTTNWNKKLNIVYVNKNNGGVDLVFEFDRKLIGDTVTNNPGLSYWKYLGFITQNEFLFEFYQTDNLMTTSTISPANDFNYNRKYQDQHLIHRYIVKFNIKSNMYEILTKINSGNVTLSMNNSIMYEDMYKIFGTGIINELNNSQFMAISTASTLGTSVNYSY